MFRPTTPLQRLTIQRQRPQFLQSARLARPRKWQQPQFRRTYWQRPQYQRFRSAPASRAADLLYRWAASPRFYRDVGILSAGAGTVYVWNLEEVPVSGRRRFNIISPSFEAYLAEGTEQEIKREYRGRFLSDWDPRVRKVKAVLERLLPFVQQAGGLEHVDWEVHVIESPEMNAFVIPGGKIFVFTGILPLCRDEDGLAAVLAHEISHVIAHHTAERMSRAPFVLLGVIALAMFDFSLYSSKMLLDLFLTLPGSRRQEAEADYIGLLMMAQACYRPEAAMEFWARMERRGQAGPPQILSTHPSNHNRQEKIREWLPKAHERAERAECGMTSHYADQYAQAFGGLGRGSPW